MADRLVAVIAGRKRMGQTPHMANQDLPDNAASPRSKWIIPLAILVGAAIVATTIFLTSRSDECDQWNKRVRAHVREAELFINQAKNAPPGHGPAQEEATQIQSRLRRTLAEQPESCEITSETAEQVLEMVGRMAP